MFRFWLWIAFGVLLALSELAVPGFFIIFFGAGAIATAFVLWFCPTLSLAWTIVCFTASSVAMLLICRYCLPRIFRGRRGNVVDDVDSDAVVGSDVVVAERIAPGMAGSVDFRGARWQARSDRELAPGEHAKVVRRDNLTLVVE